MLPHPCAFCKGGRGLGRGAGNHGSGATLDTKLMARRVQFPSIKRQPAELISRSPEAKDGAQEPLLRTRKAQEWEGLAASLPTLAKSARVGQPQIRDRSDKRVGQPAKDGTPSVGMGQSRQSRFHCHILPK